MNAWFCPKALQLFVCLVVICSPGSGLVCAQDPRTGPDTIQTAGSVSGTVVDQQGAVISDAKVTLKNMETAALLNTRSDTNGQFSLTGVPFGTYELEVTADGFARYLMRIELSKDLSFAPHDATLKAGEIALTVRINNNVDVSSVTTVCIICGYTYFSLPVKSLPLYERDPQTLVRLQSGVVEDLGAGKGGFSISGGRPAAKTILMDGVDDRNPVTGNSVATISLDSVQEFNSDYYADNSSVGSTYGQNRAPQLSTVTRAGTNVLHGEGLWYAGRSSLDANGFFANRAGCGRDQLRYDQFFGALGGPITLPGLLDGRDHEFFFASFEHTRDSQASGQQIIAPLPSFVRGLAGVEGRLFQQTFAPILSSLTSPAGAPSSNGTGDFGVVENTAGIHNLGLARISVRASDRISLDGRYLLDQSYRQSDLNRGAFTPSSPLATAGRAGLIGVDASISISPRMVNTVRAGYRWVRTGISGGGSDSIHLVAVNDPLDVLAGLPQVPQQNNHHSFLGADTFTFVAGHHTFNAGIQVSRRSESYVTGGLAGGRIYYSDLLALATDGAMSTIDPAHSIIQVALGVQSREQYRPTDLYAFATDAWRPSPRVVVSYGLGYFYYSGAGYDGAAVAKRNFAPTISFAIGLTRSESFILRGGSSILYAPPVSIPYGELLASPLYPLASGRASLADFVGSPLPRGWTGQGVEIDREFAGKIHPAYTESSFLALQRAAGASLIVEAEYHNSLAHHLIRFYRDGAVPGSIGGLLPLVTPGSFVIASDANSAYHSLQVRVTSREKAGLVFQAHYTFSKSIDSISVDGPDIYQSLAQGAVYGDQPALDRGPSDFDRRHRLVGFFLWRGPEAPKLPRALAALLSRWELSGIATFQSGPYVTLYSSGDFYGGKGDFNMDGVLNDRLAFVGTGSPSSAISSAAGTLGRTSPADAYFNASLFGSPGSGRVGLGRNVLPAPPYAAIDTALQRRIRLSEGHRLDVRIEGFNITNSVNFQPPVTNLVSTDFGRSVAASNPRVVRAAVRYSF